MVDDIKLPEKGKRSLSIETEDVVPEPSFSPPEVIAHEDEIIDMADEAMTEKKSDKIRGKKTTNKKPSKIRDLFIVIKLWWKARSKKQKILLVLLALLLAAALSYGGYALFIKQEPTAAVVVVKEEKKEPPKPTTEASQLTGIQVPIGSNQTPVTGIMIENSPDARPQSGLKDAGVVFEAVAEGGITRFLTLFQEAQPDYVGPVRSVRPYYLSWLQGFDAAVGHVGGSPEALAKIRNEGIKDLDQSFNASSYQRVSSRYAPHNVYTSLASLIALGKSKGYNTSTFVGFVRKPEKPVTPPTAKTVDIAISGPLYDVHYDYDVASNSYLRSLAGRPHLDDRSGQQIKPKVVIAIVLPKGIHPDGVHTTYGTIGTGTAYIFQDGTVTQGTWSKASDKEQLLFGDANGAPIGLNPGQTWISAVGVPTSVTYAP